MLRRAIPRLYSTAIAPSPPPSAASTSKIDEMVDAAERRILSLFDRYGDLDYIGEPCSITEHCVQAANAAARAGETETAQLACLLHDVGHLAGLEAGHEPGMDGCGTPEHERVGAELLGALGLPDDVAFLTHRHVDAKRYLCATRPDYYGKLTDASKTTLKHQGGPMTQEEVASADADPRWPLVLRMRTYDEAGKDPDGKSCPSQFVPMLRAALRKSIAGQVQSEAEAEAEAAAEKRVYPLSLHASSYVLSSEQMRFWDEHGYLIVRGALPLDRFGPDQLSSMCDEASMLPSGRGYPWLVHHERCHATDGDVRICRVENFAKHHNEWGEIAFGLVRDIVSQAFREEALLFKDKINFKGPGGGKRESKHKAAADRHLFSFLPPSHTPRHECSLSLSLSPSLLCATRRLPSASGRDRIRDRRLSFTAHLRARRNRPSR